MAKAQWLFQGTYLCEGGNISIEGFLVDVRSQRLLRIEKLTGSLDDVFKLERRLIRQLLSDLDLSQSVEEARRATLLKTQSLSAFEHYSRSLAEFDAGKWYAAIEQARLARRADPKYLLAAARVAQLYHEVGEFKHALVEYRNLIAQD
jgi:tetratricopeptide (TPR) repeat protein